MYNIDIYWILLMRAVPVSSETPTAPRNNAMCPIMLHM